MPDAIPVPDATGAAGTQRETAPAELQVVSPVVAVSGLALAQTIQGLAASNSRSLGGEVSANLLAASFTHLAQELNDTKRQLADVRTKLEDVNRELAAVNIEKSVFAERLRAIGRVRHFTNLGVAVGTLLVKFGIDLTKTDERTGYCLFAIGALIMILAWVSNPVKQKQ